MKSGQDGEVVMLLPDGNSSRARRRAFIRVGEAWPATDAGSASGAAQAVERGANPGAMPSEQIAVEIPELGFTKTCQAL